MDNYDPRSFSDSARIYRIVRLPTASQDWIILTVCEEGSDDRIEIEIWSKYEDYRKVHDIMNKI